MRSKSQINGNMFVSWFVNPKDLKNIYWNDIYKPEEETVNFEPDGDGISSYIWARRKKDNKFMRVGKVIKNYIVLPFIFGLGQFLTGLAAVYYYLDSQSNYIMLFCLYGILILVYLHYLINCRSYKDVQKISANKSYINCRQTRNV